MIVPDTIWHPELPVSGKSKYKALAQAIREGIAMGHLAPGTKLPPVRDLAFRVKVTPGTVARAYTLLTEEGRLRAEVGRGTFVAAGRVARTEGATPLVNLPVDAVADFRSSRVPDVGQGQIIDAALIKLGESHRRRHINYPTAETDLEARMAVVSWIDQERSGGVGPENVVLGNGAQNCCILALQAELSGQNPIIMTEELGYPGARHAARLLRAQTVGLPMDDEGILPEFFRQACRDHGGRILLTSAEVHSPTTIRTSLARKQEIAQIARQLDITIIEDDCHTTAQSDIPSYRSILPDQSYLVSSLTKSVSGALRFGYAIAPVGREKELRQVAQSSFYGVAQPILDLCHALITSGAASEIRDRVVAETAIRARLAVNALGAWDLRWREDAPFVYLNMPQGWRASGFAMACEKRDILIKPADEFALPHCNAPNAVRLAINTCASDDLFLKAMSDMNHLLANPESRIDG
ncbi:MULTISPECIES: PLP-dependent aminotransferase family protein [unclassified Yoonia]|uniref:aminotransferase-like domain-containing protein n=1 Tax=unclassified Yoonia TaxID=2629118 RepID=UPI002AFE635C|nr:MULTISPECIES: PLP-dependent aminotransferase family protein [unclassified Yoonia]